MRAFSFFRIIQLLVVSLFLTPAQGVRIAGSDLLSPEISRALLAELKAANVAAEIELVGSVRAQDALSAGEVDVCIIAVPDSAQQPDYERVYGFAFQIVAFAVNTRNPLEELDYSQLENIFKRSGSIDTWTGLVTMGRLQDRKINIWATRSHSVISLEIFNSMVLKGAPLKESVRYDAQSAEQMMQVVRNDDAAMILVPNMPSTDDVRLLAIKQAPGGQSYTPTPDNVFYGDYPLRLPFQLIVDKDLAEAELSILLRALYSDRVTRSIERARFMPLPELERQAILNQFK